MNRASSILFLLLGLAPWAVAQDQGDTDSLAIRHVIEEQWQAFLDDDAEKAFSLASPSVRDTFGTADNFMMTVRNDYPMVYRHAASQFLDEEVHPGFSFQLVKLSLTDGEVWLVVYQMQKQSDGGWKIGGVVAVPRGERPEVQIQPPSDST
jgi:hypothetical protein